MIKSKLLKMRIYYKKTQFLAETLLTTHTLKKSIRCWFQKQERLEKTKYKKSEHLHL